MRAIDADALKRKAQKVATEAWKMKITGNVETVLNQFIDWIDVAPTIEPDLFNNNILRHPQCTSRTKLGNCDPVGGFCTSVPKEMCDAQEHEKYIDADLISRKAAIDVVEESRRLNHHQDGKTACAHEYEHRHFLKILRDLPHAQPEIIRCKECAYASKDDYTHCPYVTWWNSKDDFCSKGKRRTDE